MNVGLDTNLPHNNGEPNFTDVSILNKEASSTLNTAQLYLFEGRKPADSYWVSVPVNLG